MTEPRRYKLTSLKNVPLEGTVRLADNQLKTSGDNNLTFPDEGGKVLTSLTMQPIATNMSHLVDYLENWALAGNITMGDIKQYVNGIEEDFKFTLLEHTITGYRYQIDHVRAGYTFYAVRQGDTDAAMQYELGEEGDNTIFISTATVPENLRIVYVDGGNNEVVIPLSTEVGSWSIYRLPVSAEAEEVVAGYDPNLDFVCRATEPEVATEVYIKLQFSAFPSINGVKVKPAYIADIINLVKFEGVNNTVNRSEKQTIKYKGLAKLFLKSKTKTFYYHDYFFTGTISIKENSSFEVVLSTDPEHVTEANSIRCPINLESVGTAQDFPAGYNGYNFSLVEKRDPQEGEKSAAVFFTSIPSGYQYIRTVNQKNEDLGNRAIYYPSEQSVALTSPSTEPLPLQLVFTNPTTNAEAVVLYGYREDIMTANPTNYGKEFVLRCPEADYTLNTRLCFTIDSNEYSFVSVIDTGLLIEYSTDLNTDHHLEYNSFTSGAGENDTRLRFEWRKKLQDKYHFTTQTTDTDNASAGVCMFLQTQDESDIFIRVKRLADDTIVAFPLDLSLQDGAVQLSVDEEQLNIHKWSRNSSGECEAQIFVEKMPYNYTFDGVRDANNVELSSDRVSASIESMFISIIPELNQPLPLYLRWRNLNNETIEIPYTFPILGPNDADVVIRRTVE